MMRKFILCLSILLCATGFQTLSAQLCKPDTSLHKPGYKPPALPVVHADSQYNQSISILVKRDTFKMVGPTKVNVKIDSVRATSILGLPTGYSYQCQNPRCVFLWDTVRCVRIYGSTSKGGTFPILIPITGYAKIGSSSFIQKDTIRDFTLLVIGGAAGTMGIANLKGWKIAPNPATNQVSIYSEKHISAQSWMIMDMEGRKMPVQFEGNNGVYTANTSSLASGLYLVTNGLQVKKLIISTQ